MLQISNPVFLTVLGAPPPTPTIAAPVGVPTVIEEILTPFQFDNSGALKGTLDPGTRFAQHLLAILFTRRNERVMMPAYGVGVQDYVFEPGDQLLAAQLFNSAKEQVSYWEPSVSIVGIQPLPSDYLNGEIRLQMSFTVGTNPTQHVVVYDLSGQSTEI